MWSVTTFGDFRVQYESGVRVFPAMPESYLFAFKDLENAQKYIEGADKILTAQAVLQIWEAQAHVVMDGALLVPAYQYETYWMENQFAMEYPKSDFMAAPDGTVLCEWVKLVDMVGGGYPAKRRISDKNKDAVLI